MNNEPTVTAEEMTKEKLKHYHQVACWTGAAELTINKLIIAVSALQARNKELEAECQQAHAVVGTLEAENKLLREEWERMNECLEDYVSGCEEFKHRPHCYCLPAVEVLATIKFAPSDHA